MEFILDLVSNHDQMSKGNNCFDGKFVYFHKDARERIELSQLSALIPLFSLKGLELQKESNLNELYNSF
jgi:hypothetical protein